jgi:Spy/CpxP family protein refolding chaperone
MRKIIPALAASLLAATIAPALAETTVETKPLAPQEEHGGAGHEGCCKMMHEMRQMHEQMMMDHMKSMHQGHDGIEACLGGGHHPEAPPTP